MNSSTQGLLDHPLLWRGRQRSHTLATLSTGHAVLDAALPGHGWPLGAVTEIIHAVPGCGEFSLLLPILAQLSREQGRIVMVDPPWIPYPPALCGHGLALEKLLLVRTHTPKESLWACEQALRGMPAGAVLAWPENPSFSTTRCLQLAAKSSRKMAFLFRADQAASNASPAALRLQLSADHNDLLIRVLKCRGRRPATALRIQRAGMFQPLMPLKRSTTQNC